VTRIVNGRDAVQAHWFRYRLSYCNCIKQQGTRGSGRMAVTATKHFQRSSVICQLTHRVTLGGFNQGTAEWNYRPN
jgi:hypothetical protein